MKYFLLLLSIVLLFSNAQAQIVTSPDTLHEGVLKLPKNLKEERKLRKVQIGVCFSPDIDNRMLFVNQPNQGAGPIIADREMIETAKFGYTTGVVLVYNLNKHFGFESGIQYSNKGFQSKWLDITYIAIRPQTYITQAKYIYSYHYLDVPFKLNLTAGAKAVRFVGTLGLTANILLKTDYTVKAKYTDGSTVTQNNKSKEDFNKGNLSPSVGAGIDYRFSDRVSLKIQPTIRFGVIKIIDTPVTALLWNAGLNISLLFGV